MPQHFLINRRSAVLALFLGVSFSFVAIAQATNPASKLSIGDTPPYEIPAAVARGRVLYNNRCAICHFNESDAKKIGPGLKDIYQRGKFANGSRVDDAAMEKLILNGGKDMPPFKPRLNPTQVHDLIAYLRTL